MLGTVQYAMPKMRRIELWEKDIKVEKDVKKVVAKVFTIHMEKEVTPKGPLGINGTQDSKRHNGTNGVPVHIKILATNLEGKEKERMMQIIWDSQASPSHR